jgi:hypothetical protein
MLNLHNFFFENLQKSRARALRWRDAPGFYYSSIQYCI